jgi:hypothetical protein
MPEGYGVAYMINSGSIHYNIASLRGGPGREAGPGSWLGKGSGVERPCEKLSHYLQESLRELRDLFENELRTANNIKLTSKL